MTENFNFNHIQNNSLSDIIINTPLDQFQIQNIIGIYGPLLGGAHISINNMTLYIIIGTFICFYFLILTSNVEKIVSNY